MSVKCDECGCHNVKVLDSRPKKNNKYTLRRLECARCKVRFNSIEMSTGGKNEGTFTRTVLPLVDAFVGLTEANIKIIAALVSALTKR